MTTDFRALLQALLDAQEHCRELGCRMPATKVNQSRGSYPFCDTHEPNGRDLPTAAATRAALRALAASWSESTPNTEPDHECG